jgi:Flp pilus assembly pilin Flp
MAMCVALAIVGSVSFTGAQLNNAYSEISSSFN